MDRFTQALLVEHDPGAQLALGSMLEEHDCRVTAASNTEQARAALGRASFDLVVLDGDLPYGDALELLDELHQAGLPVVYVSGGDTTEARRRGAAATSGRPLDLAEIGASIQAIRNGSTRAPNETLQLKVAVACRDWEGFRDHDASQLSERSLFVHTEDAPAVLSELQLRLALPNLGEATIEGQVKSVLSKRRAKAKGKQAGMLVHLGALTPEIRDAIDALLSGGSSPTLPAPPPPPAAVAPPKPDPARSSLPAEAAPLPDEQPPLPPDRDEAPAISPATEQSSPSGVHALTAAMGQADRRRQGRPPGGPGPLELEDDGLSEADRAAREQARAELRRQLERLQGASPSEQLNVAAEADRRTIKRAFIELSRRYHPDVFAHYREAELSQLAEEIYVILSEAETALRQAAQLRAAADGSDVRPPAGPGGAPPPADQAAPAAPPHPRRSAVGGSTGRRPSPFARPGAAGGSSPSIARRSAATVPVRSSEPTPEASYQTERSTEPSPQAVRSQPGQRPLAAQPAPVGLDSRPGRSPVEVAGFYEDGLTALREDRFRDARNLLSLAVKHEPEHDDYRALLEVARGCLLKEEGKLEEALAHFKQALEIDKHCARAAQELKESENDRPEDSGFFKRWFKRG